MAAYEMNEGSAELHVLRDPKLNKEILGMRRSEELSS
jgi:hypothetical protein